MNKSKLRCIAFVIVSSASAFLSAAEKPNVILVVTDDQGYGDMSCHGNPWLKTPEIDRLYNTSVRLTDYHVDPTCSPTRGALMSGRYSTRVGVWLTYSSRHHLRKDELCIAEAFRRNGYKTGMFGKWHLGDNYPYRPQDRGFEESLVHGGGVVGETPDHWGNDYYDDVYFRDGKSEPVTGYCTDVWFDEAIKFIDAHKDKPFFSYIATNAPHGPLFVPESYCKPYQGQPDIPAKRALFYGMIASIDENMGRLREKLEELSLDRDTIVIFMNDNGTAGGVSLKGGKHGWEVGGFNAGMRGRKGSPYEGGHRAACFVRWPGGGIDGGRDIEELSAHIDIMPTLIDLCDLTLDRDVDFDGISLAQLLQNETATIPSRTLLVHHQGRFGNPVGEGKLIRDKDYAVMTEKWRLVGGELYELKRDKSQRNDVASEHPEVVGRLKGAYDQWWQEIEVADDVYDPFIIDPAKQSTVMISSQNLLGGHVAYNQQHVRAGMLIEQSFAVIDVAKPGRYRITLRRWPRELDRSIEAVVPPAVRVPERHDMNDKLSAQNSKALKVTSARLKVGGFDKTVPVKSGDKEVVFDVDLKEGEQEIQTWFNLDDGESTAAYYQYIEPANEGSLSSM